MIASKRLKGTTSLEGNDLESSLDSWIELNLFEEQKTPKPTSNIDEEKERERKHKLDVEEAVQEGLVCRVQRVFYV